MMRRPDEIGQQDYAPLSVGDEARVRRGRACEIATGLALRPAAAPGRLILMAGGLAGVLVAVNPEHAGGSLAHACWAGAGFAALVTWPAGAWRGGLSVPWGLRPAVSAARGGPVLSPAAGPRTSD
jgi:hypothetical protein